ncbi:hypothetical protein BC477_15355 [Clavibacter michiganensis subsp. michiganensis]|uniref:Secreted protein n=1 Tax=Clavibacter michiganensis subsp. michiganensis TaxID=33013 RepID=A0A251XCK8_CLAMM|nr:hypothetical protein BC477_15355 [Clavibacter michiganensis subsp. michiganensis]OUD99782.1 hypothetical protein CMMCAS07_20120 [Clavibacter michiganensis subsp. michiganensis]
MITPRLRSTALPKVWLMLGCTTSSAAIVAKMGSCAGSRAMQTNQAMIAATDVLTTWTNGIRVVVRTVVVMRTCGLRRRFRVDPSSRGRRAQATGASGHLGRVVQPVGPPPPCRLASCQRAHISLRSHASSAWMETPRSPVRLVRPG